MVTHRPTSSLTIEILRIFRNRIQKNSAWTVEEIWQALKNRNLRGYRAHELEIYLIDSSFGRDFPNPLQWLLFVLEDLAELGLVTPADSAEESSGFPRWRLGDSWHPPEPPSGGGDGDGGRIGPAADDGDGDDGGGGGLREALGHPVLLALTKGDFDKLVEDLFEEEQP